MPPLMEEPSSASLSSSGEPSSPSRRSSTKRPPRVKVLFADPKVSVDDNGKGDNKQKYLSSHRGNTVDMQSSSKNPEPSQPSTKAPWQYEIVYDPNLGASAEEQSKEEQDLAVPKPLSPSRAPSLFRVVSIATQEQAKTTRKDVSQTSSPHQSSSSLTVPMDSGKEGEDFWATVRKHEKKLAESSEVTKQNEQDGSNSSKASPGEALPQKSASVSKPVSSIRGSGPTLPQDDADLPPLQQQEVDRPPSPDLETVEESHAALRMLDSLLLDNPVVHRLTAGLGLHHPSFDEDGFSVSMASWTTGMTSALTDPHSKSHHNEEDDHTEGEDYLVVYSPHTSHHKTNTQESPEERETLDLPSLQLRKELGIAVPTAPSSSFHNKSRSLHSSQNLQDVQEPEEPVIYSPNRKKQQTQEDDAGKNERLERARQRMRDLETLRLSMEGKKAKAAQGLSSSPRTEPQAGRPPAEQMRMKDGDKALLDAEEGLSKASFDEPSQPILIDMGSGIYELHARKDVMEGMDVDVQDVESLGTLSTDIRLLLDGPLKSPPAKSGSITTAMTNPKEGTRSRRTCCYIIAILCCMVVGSIGLMVAALVVVFVK